MMLPPLPPSPPSGPPRGTNFSRRKLMQPSPPRPASTSMVTRSTNIGVGVRGRGSEVGEIKKGCPAGIPGRLQRFRSALIGAWDHVHAAALAIEQYLAIDQREE